MKFIYRSPVLGVLALSRTRIGEALADGERGKKLWQAPPKTENREIKGSSL